MALKIRLPEPTSIQDPETRAYLNELIRALSQGFETIVTTNDFLDTLEQNLVEGSGISLTEDFTNKTLVVATSS